MAITPRKFTAIAVVAIGAGLTIAYAAGSFTQLNSGTTGPGPESPERTISVEFQDMDGSTYFCAPANWGAVSSSFAIRQPASSSFPSGYDLRVLQDSGNRVTLYYDDAELCPLSQTKVNALLSLGTIAVSISPMSSSIASNQLFSADLESYKEDEIVSGRIRTIDINGYMAFGWDFYDETGEIEAESKPSGWTLGTLFFYHDPDRTVYAIYANESFEGIVEIARTIPTS